MKFIKEDIQLKESYGTVEDIDDILYLVNEELNNQYWSVMTEEYSSEKIDIYNFMTEEEARKKYDELKKDTTYFNVSLNKVKLVPEVDEIENTYPDEIEEKENEEK